LFTYKSLVRKSWFLSYNCFYVKELFEEVVNENKIRQTWDHEVSISSTFYVQLRAKDGIFRTFCFWEFRNSSVFKVRKFFGNIRSFQTRKNFVFGNKFGNNFLFFALKTLFLRVLGSKLKKQGFPNILNLRKILNLFYSKLSKNNKKNDV